MLGLELCNVLSVNPVQGQNSWRIFDFWHENYCVELEYHSAISSISKASECYFLEIWTALLIIFMDGKKKITEVALKGALFFFLM